MRPLLSDVSLKPGPADMAAASRGARDLLRIRMSTRLFRLGSLSSVQDKVSFLDAPPGVIGMLIDDTAGISADPVLHGVLVIFNATPASVTISPGSGWELHPVQASGFDSVVKTSTVSAGGSVTVPGRTTAVFVR